MEQLIGRERECKLLEEAVESPKAELIAVYGRRRVGKTFLVKFLFENQFVFYTTGVYDGTLDEQLTVFQRQLNHYSGLYYPKVTKWSDAFEQLINYLSSLDEKKSAVLFFDEMPWMDAPSSHFIKAFDVFWNGWASSRPNIKLIVCGSATTWMMDNIVTNKGGLYNRSTRRIKLAPFSLYECEQYLNSKGLRWNRYQIAECYMILGGIPYYLQALHRGLSVAQNIDDLFFREDAELFGEYELLLRSLFKRPAVYKKVIEVLGARAKGMTRSEIIRALHLQEAGGGLTEVLKDLISCDFIRAYGAYGKKERDTLYQLTDFFTLFHLKYLENYKGRDEHRWSNLQDSPAKRAWMGYSFEMLCLHHLAQIKAALGISGVASDICSWSVQEKKDEHPGGQIDLLIDRRDQIINLCEMKFSTDEYELTGAYLKKLTERAELFRKITKTRKALHLTFVTTYGLQNNPYAGMIQNVVTLDDLFKNKKP